MYFNILTLIYFNMVTHPIILSFIILSFAILSFVILSFVILSFFVTFENGELKS